MSIRVEAYKYWEDILGDSRYELGQFGENLTVSGLAGAEVCVGNRVLLLEAPSTIGGGMRTTKMTLPGFLHDVCSAVHPMAKASPFFRTLPLEQYGLQYIGPEIPVAHPLDEGEAVCRLHSIDETASSLVPDRGSYLKLFRPLVDEWETSCQIFSAPCMCRVIHSRWLASASMHSGLPRLSHIVSRQRPHKHSSQAWSHNEAILYF